MDSVSWMVYSPQPRLALKLRQTTAGIEVMDLRRWVHARVVVTCERA